MEAEPESHILIDAHAHLYDCYDLNTYFLSATKNFARASQVHAAQKAYTYCLFLVNGAEKGIDRLNTAPNSAVAQILKVEKTQEPCTLLVSKNNCEIIVIGGRQLVTRENLEVLAVGTRKNFKEHRPLNEMIEDIKQEGALAIVPWGFGKWWRTRGKIIEDYLRDAKDSSELAIGDSGNRPFFIPKEAIFNIATKQGILNLPGSDPLPFSADAKRPGSFGSVWHGRINRNRPFESLQKIIKNPVNGTDFFGSPESISRFFLNQVRMQLRKR